MIVENRKFLRWTWFADEVRPSFNTVYLFTTIDRVVAGMRKVKQYDMQINLERSEEELLASYQPSTRNYLKQAPSKYRLTMETTTNHRCFLELFNKNATILGLLRYEKSFFETKKHFLIQNIYDERKLLASHLYLLDRDSRQVICIEQCSAFRFFQEEGRKISTSNKYLFHRSFLYFSNRGFKKFYFGGYNHPDASMPLEGVRDFKDSFRGKIVGRFHYYPAWYQSLKTGQQALKRFLHIT